MDNTIKSILPDEIRTNVREHYAGIAEKQTGCGCRSSSSAASSCCGSEDDPKRWTR